MKYIGKDINVNGATTITEAHFWGKEADENLKDVRAIVLADDVKEVYGQFFKRFPNLMYITCSKSLEIFNFEENLAGCQNIDRVWFGNGQYNHKIKVFGNEIPFAVRQSLSETGWYELLRYRPDLYTQIPSKMFGYPMFEKNSVNAVIYGMTERVKKLSPMQLPEQMKKDELTLNGIKFCIEQERKKRKSERELITDMYEQFKKDLFEK